MKRLWLIMLAIAGLGGSVWAEFRFDLGLDTLFVQSSEPAEEEVLFSGTPIVIPEFGLYGQFKVGPLHFGGGLRGFSYLLLYTGVWPSVYMEINLGKSAVLHAGVGGMVYGIFDLLSSYEEEPELVYNERTGEWYSEDCGTLETASPTAKVLFHKSIIPEISLWFRLGRFFSIGGGGLLILSFENDGKNIFDLDPRFYAGIRVSFPGTAPR